MTASTTTVTATRDINVAEIARRFDHDTNDGVSIDERFEVPDTLQVEQNNYPTFDRAVTSIAMTETKRILGQQFAARWQADPELKPLLLRAYERTERSLGLDKHLDADGSVDLNGSSVTINMSGLSLDTTAGFQWTAYCAPPATDPLWEPCDSDVYWEELVNRVGETVVLDGDPDDPDLASGRMVATQLYYMAVAQGVNRLVERDGSLIANNLEPESDADVKNTIKVAKGLAGAGKSVVGFIANTTVFAFFKDNPNKAIAGLSALAKLAKGIKARDLKDIKNAFLVKDNLGNKSINDKAIHGVARMGLFLAVTAINIALIFVPSADATTRIVLRSVTTALTLGLKVIAPIYDVVTSGAKLTGWVSQIGTSLKANAIGAVIAVGIVWGLFIYSMAANSVTAFSPQFNQALAETIAATMLIVYLAWLSATVIGAIIVGIIALIDAVLLLICEAGVDALKQVPGLGGSCFTLNSAAVKVISKALYSFDLMIDTARSDLVVTGAPDVQLTDPTQGFSLGNGLEVAMPVTTTVVHKDPVWENWFHILPYLWLFSTQNLRSTTFQYSLTDGANRQTINAVPNQMNEDWTVAEDHKFALTPMYRAQASTRPAPADLALNTPWVESDCGLQL